MEIVKNRHCELRFFSVNKNGINLYFLLTKLGSQGAFRQGRLHPIVVTPLSRINVQMSDGTVLHGVLEPYRLAVPPIWIPLPRLLEWQGNPSSMVAYVRMADGTGMIAALRETEVLGRLGHSAPLIAVSSVVHLRNGTSSRAVLSLLDSGNNARIEFSTSGTCVFIGFVDGLVFTGMFEEVY